MRNPSGELSINNQSNPSYSQSVKKSIDADLSKKNFPTSNSLLEQKREDMLMLTLTDGRKVNLQIKDGILTKEDIEPFRKMIKEVVIPDSVTKIGNRAFRGCDGLTNVVIPDSVTIIGEGAFMQCENLTNVVIPDGVTEIGDQAFLDCKNLTNVVIGDSVTTIGNGAFCGCECLTGVVIGDSVTTIGNGAFMQCKNLTDVVIPDSVTKIGDMAFRHCENLTNVVIPDSVTEIAKGTFEFCKSLKEIWLPEGSKFDIELLNDYCKIRYYKKGKFNEVLEYLEAREKLEETRKNLED